MPAILEGATMSDASFEPTQRSRLGRQPIRGAYDAASVFAVLDAALMAHVGYVIDGQPFVTPTAFWREGRRLYWHGSAGSRMLNALADGVPACVTVSLLDGLVCAPSGFKHSINYRSVMAFGRARLVAEPEAKRRALDGFLDRIYPGRAATLRPASDEELAKTSVVAMTIEEASAKVRRGGVVRIAEDKGWPAWSGVLPLETRFGAPEPDALIGARALGLATPPPCAEGDRLDAGLSAAAGALEPA
jgi:nitroimidazol reductase NimA-like FMN-containing flavoprotein (pyridoxamine 5'-phosphate oxidase superfamily)